MFIFQDGRQKYWDNIRQAGGGQKLSSVPKKEADWRNRFQAWVEAQLYSPKFAMLKSHLERNKIGVGSFAAYLAGTSEKGNSPQEFIFYLYRGKYEDKPSARRDAVIEIAGQINELGRMINSNFGSLGYSIKGTLNSKTATRSGSGSLLFGDKVENNIHYIIEKGYFLLRRGQSGGKIESSFADNSKLQEALGKNIPLAQGQGSQQSGGQAPPQGAVWQGQIRQEGDGASRGELVAKRDSAGKYGRWVQYHGLCASLDVYDILHNSALSLQAKISALEKKIRETEKTDKRFTYVPVYRKALVKLKGGGGKISPPITMQQLQQADQKKRNERELADLIARRAKAWDSENYFEYHQIYAKIIVLQVLHDQNLPEQTKLAHLKEYMDGAQYSDYSETRYPIFRDAYWTLKKELDKMEPAVPGKTPPKTETKPPSASKAFSLDEELKKNQTLHALALKLYRKMGIGTGDRESISYGAFKAALFDYIIGTRHNREGKQYVRGNSIIVDYSVPSTKPRIHIVDFEQGKLLHSTFANHGGSSGSKKMLKSVSNRSGSEKSPAGGFRLAQYAGKGYNQNKGGARKGRRNAFGLEGYATYGNQNAPRRHILLHIPKEFTLPSSEDEVPAGGLPRSGGCVSISREDFDAAFSSLPYGTAMFVYVRNNQIPTADRTVATLSSQMKLISRASGMKLADILALPVQLPRRQITPRKRPARRWHSGPGHGNAPAQNSAPTIQKKKPKYPY